MGCLQRSQELFISKPVYAPNRNDPWQGASARSGRVFGIAGEHGSYANYTIASERDGPIAKIPDGIGAVSDRRTSIATNPFAWGHGR